MSELVHPNAIKLWRGITQMHFWGDRDATSRLLETKISLTRNEELKHSVVTGPETVCFAETISGEGASRSQKGIVGIF